MGRVVLALCLSLLLLAAGASSAPSYHHSAKIVSGLFSDVVAALMKWVWSLRTAAKPAASNRPMMKFESGYNVETVFDGSKLGVEPYAVEQLPSGELLILDSANSNLYKISSSLSLYSRPRLVAGSAEGYAGHVDGKHREAKLNHPKGITVDDKGNIYVADADNMAIRRISDAGVTTIAGGKWGRSGGHVDGPSEDARFSSDFDVVYVGSSCSLLVIDRGNKAIREIQLHFDDCAYQYGSGFPLGIAVLVAACFFGYMLALLQKRVSSIVSSHSEPMPTSYPPSPYQKPMKSVRPPLIPPEDYVEKPEEGLFDSVGKLFANAGAAVGEILAGLIPGRRRKAPDNEYNPSQQIYSQQRAAGAWPAQESFVIPREDEPPSIDTRAPTPRKTYPFMSRDSEKMQQIRQSRVFYRGLEGEPQRLHQHQQQQRHQHQTSAPQTVFEQSADSTEEIVFGAVQEQEVKRRAVVIKPVDYERSFYDHAGVRHRYNSMGYGGYGTYA
uniref:Teneurin NHL domain-containing protein n=1 Tax=Kalanchoe fedtschenkoi TaxID=63787 RepID=A0A7N0VFG3_KALFE